MRRLASHLQLTATAPATTLADGLAAAIQAVRGDHDSRCDLDHPNTPAASTSLIRAAGDRLDYLVLSDAYLALDLGAQVRVVTDDRFAVAVADIRQAVLTVPAAIGTLEHDGRVRRAALARQQRTNQPGGYWIAAATPEAAYQAVTGEHPLTGPRRVRRAVLLTDGASSAVERFGLLDWLGLLDLVTEHGPRELIRRVRAAESVDAAGQHQPRYKRHDDASVALCLFEEQPWTSRAVTP